MHSFDPRSPPGMAEKEAEKEEIRKRKEAIAAKGRRMLDAAAEREYCLPLLIAATTILMLSTLVHAPSATLQPCFP